MALSESKIYDRAFREKISILEKFEKLYSDEMWFKQMSSRLEKSDKQLSDDLKLKGAVGWVNQPEDG